MEAHIKRRKIMILQKMKRSMAKMKLMIGVRKWFDRYGKVNERLVPNHKHRGIMVRQLPLVTVQ